MSEPSGQEEFEMKSRSQADYSDTQKLLRSFVKQYRDPTRLAEIFPRFKKRVKRIRDISKIPPLPDGFAQTTHGRKRSRLIKWYSTRNGQMLSYYDDGSRLPDTSKLRLIWQTTAEATEEIAVIEIDTWILEKD